ncbi:MAG: CesT family type III secretion system chaperone [Parachlamydiaceae bacterium]
MVSDLLGTLLQELGHALGIENLHPDENNTCLIQLQNGQQIQIEMDKAGEFVLIGSVLGTVPPGRYRENLLKEALKANGMPHPIHGVLCFSTKTDHLIMFQKISLRDLRGEKIAAEITPFLDKAAIWWDAVKAGVVPLLNQHEGGGRSAGGMFGLR